MEGRLRIFDKALLDVRRRRALAHVQPGTAFLLEAVAAELVDRLVAVRRDFAIAAEVGSPLPILARRVVATGRVGWFIRMDRLRETRPDLVADEETLPFAAESLDLIVSALAFQFINDLPGALLQMRRALKPDGLLLAAFAGGDTLFELRESLAAAEAEIVGGASPRVAPFAEVRAIGNLLQRAGLALPVTDQDRYTVRYADALGLMQDLRAMGAANMLLERSRKPLRRDVLMRCTEIYAERFADPDGRVRATFEIISLSGWAPHASQQQPLRPGSAKARLADALGVVEQKTGEKAGG